MLSIFAELRSNISFELFVTHINHQLREEADAEEAYVKKFAEDLGLSFFSKKVDVLGSSREWKMSCEEAARKIRYDFFEEVARQTNANKIAVAHNANDRAETVLLNLIRGSGLDGLCGIFAENGKIIRPMLDFTREDIEMYLKEHKIVAMVDKTNFEDVYTRNKVRNCLIPYLKELNPNIVATLNRTADILSDTRQILKDTVRQEYEKLKCSAGVLSRDKFLELSDKMKTEILRMAICDFYGSNKDISRENLKNAIRILATAQSGKVVEVLKGLKIKREYDHFYFMKELESLEPYCYELSIPGDTVIKEAGITIHARIVSIEEFLQMPQMKSTCGIIREMPQTKNIVAFDIAKVGKKVYVRNKRLGDYFYPLGMSGKKTLKRFFSDLKIPESERTQWPILATEEEVVWVIGKRVSRKFLKDESTKEVIILDYGENI